MRSFVICTHHQILYRVSNQERCDGLGMWHIWGEQKCVQVCVRETWRKEITWISRVELGAVGLEIVVWIHLAQHTDEWRVVLNKMLDLQVTWREEDFLISWGTISFSRVTLLRGLQLRVSCHFALCCSWVNCFIVSLLEIDDLLLYRSSLLLVQ